MNNSPIPTAINLHKRSGTLDIVFAGKTYSLTAEFLRVHSPSAEVRGHGKGQEVLQTGKKDVQIRSVTAIGNYAIRLDFDDGHNTGIYSWSWLHELCVNRERFWQDYLQRLEAAGASRVALPADTQVITIQPSPGD